MHGYLSDVLTNTTCWFVSDEVDVVIYYYIEIDQQQFCIFVLHLLIIYMHTLTNTETLLTCVCQGSDGHSL